MKNARTLTSLVLALAALPPARAEEINRIVLRVNDKIAMLVDYEQRRAARVEAIAASTELSLADWRRLSAEAGRATMREIFEELLILSRAQQLHIEATAAKIDRAVDQARRLHCAYSTARIPRCARSLPARRVCTTIWTRHRALILCVSENICETLA